MKSFPRKTIHSEAPLLAVLLISWPTFAYTQTPVSVVAPPEAITIQDGNSSFAPFETSGRFQQVYDSSIFSVRFPPTAGLIQQVLFRVDIAGHGFRATIPNIQLNLSTTGRSADSLSTIFANNVGSDDTTALGPSSVLFLAGEGTFSVLFDVRDHPFYYDPAEGNLLIDFRINQGFGTIDPSQRVAILDAYNVAGDSISSIYASGNPGVLTGGETSSLGLATVFIFTPVPEPSILVILSIGALFLWVMLALQRRRMKKGN